MYESIVRTFSPTEAITMMNMLIGVICEVVSTAAVNEKDETAIRALKEGVLVELEKFGLNGNKKISKQELVEVIGDDDAQRVFTSWGLTCSIWQICRR